MQPEPFPSDETPTAERQTARRRSPWQRIGQPLHATAQAFTQWVLQSRQGLSQWFQVSEADLQRLLEQVRQELPTTEVILIGKAQTGKSSIIRALTGASAALIGQGFRPHTTHTQRYAYPTEDLTLLNFIDTVGLGESSLASEAVTTELQALLNQAEAPSARILVVTLKLSDFAVDAVYQLLQTLRRQFPQVPCLLTITCLHDLYPVALTQHPDYPPTLAEVQRASEALQAQFKAVVDRTVLVDFTLEEDELTPQFYGLEAFMDALAALLPDAETQVIHQLLTQAAVGSQVGALYHEAGRRYILPFSIMAATLAAVPLPFTTMPVLTALQVSLVTLLGRLYGQTLSLSQAGGVASALAGGFAAQAIGRELVKFIPGLGSVMAASWAGAYTWALGEGACLYFGDLLGGKTPNPKTIQTAMQDSFRAAQARLKTMQGTGRAML